MKAEFATMQEIAEDGRVSDGNKGLFIKRAGCEYEVSVAYYRAGYTPDDYHSETEWKVRSMIEHSAAIKCPNVGYHLAGTKAIQAALCKPGVLERYLAGDECAKLRKCFAQQYSLGDMETKEAAKEAVEAAMKDGSGWVLKPQREGGGNNYYGENLSAFLKNRQSDPILNGKEFICLKVEICLLIFRDIIMCCVGYVLMQRIFPDVQQTILCRLGQAVQSESISELGIYGTYLGYGENTAANRDLVNNFAGYLLRTKSSGTDEGGVATGYSVLNSIALFDSK